MLDETDAARRMTERVNHLEGAVAEVHHMSSLADAPRRTVQQSLGLTAGLGGGIGQRVLATMTFARRALGDRQAGRLSRLRQCGLCQRPDLYRSTVA
jgi:hypothetical protein